MRISREKMIIIITVLIDVIGIGIVIPVMPFFVQSIGASVTTVIMLFAVFSLCSFVSAPILGALSDKFGRRPALIVSIASTAIGWFVFAGAQSIGILFLGRIIDGIAAGNFPIAQSYMADLSKSNKERTANMGLIGAVFGVGFIIGPALGSILSRVSISFPFWCVGILASLNTLAAFYFLPETNQKLSADRKISVNPFLPIYKATQDIVLRSRYAVTFLFGLAVAVQQSVFALYTEHSFNFNAQKTGYLMTAMGVIMVINQGFLLKRFWLKKFSEAQLEVWLFLFFAVGYFIMSIQSFRVFIMGVLLMVFGQSVLRSVMSSRITGFSDQSKKGETAGIMSSLMTLGMVIGPLAVGTIYGISSHLPFVVSGLILFVAFLIMYFGRRRLPESKYVPQEAEPVEVL